MKLIFNRLSATAEKEAGGEHAKKGRARFWDDLELEGSGGFAESIDHMGASDIHFHFIKSRSGEGPVVVLVIAGIDADHIGAIDSVGAGDGKEGVDAIEIHGEMARAVDGSEGDRDR